MPNPNSNLALFSFPPDKPVGFPDKPMSDQDKRIGRTDTPMDLTDRLMGRQPRKVLFKAQEKSVHRYSTEAILPTEAGYSILNL